MKINTFTTALVISLSSAVSAGYAATQTVDICVKAIQKQKPGEIIKLEKLNVSGKPFYEFEIKDSGGAEWEFMCNTQNGKVTETESEADNAEAEAFKKNMKIAEKEASDIALKAHAGKIVEVEYEIESNGAPSYEFDIVNDKGLETKVEVDAVSGKIIEVSKEEWEIGEEAEEKR